MSLLPLYPPSSPPLLLPTTSPLLFSPLPCPFPTAPCPAASSTVPSTSAECTLASSLARSASESSSLLYMCPPSVHLQPGDRSGGAAFRSSAHSCAQPDSLKLRLAPVMKAFTLVADQRETEVEVESEVRGALTALVAPTSAVLSFASSPLSIFATTSSPPPFSSFPAAVPLRCTLRSSARYVPRSRPAPAGPGPLGRIKFEAGTVFGCRGKVRAKTKARAAHEGSDGAEVTPEQWIKRVIDGKRKSTELMQLLQQQEEGSEQK